MSKKTAKASAQIMLDSPELTAKYVEVSRRLVDVASELNADPQAVAGVLFGTGVDLFRNQGFSREQVYALVDTLYEFYALPEAAKLSKMHEPS